MFVDRQSYFSCLMSLIIVILSQEIIRFRAANIAKIKKSTTFFLKKSEFRDVFLMIYHQRHVNGDGGFPAVSGATE